MPLGQQFCPKHVWSSTDYGSNWPQVRSVINHVSTSWHRRKNQNGPNPYRECYSSARTTNFTFHRKTSYCSTTYGYTSRRNFMSITKSTSCNYCSRSSPWVRTNHSVQNVPTGSSFTDYLQGVNLEELLSDFPGNVQNNTCNNTQCNHNTFTLHKFFMEMWPSFITWQ